MLTYREETMKIDVEVPTCREGVFVPTSFAGPKEIIGMIQRAEHLGLMPSGELIL